jgi:hypothetical protein
MKKMFQKAKGRDFSLVYQGVAFFIIMADMASDEEAREGIAEIAKMINSTDDFLDLLDFFALADDEISLPVAVVSNDTLNSFRILAEAEYGLFPQAHASIPTGTGIVIGKVLKELAPVLAKTGKESPKVLGVIGRELKRVDLRDLLKHAFNKDFLRGSLFMAKRVGIQKIRALLTAGNNKRIRPLMLISIIAFLEEEVQAGRLFPESQHVFDRKHNLNELRKLYVKALPSFAASGSADGYVINIANGASYHLMQLAYFHAASLSSNGAIASVMGIEVPREVFIYKTQKTFDDADIDQKTFKGLSFGREVDILLGERRSGEIWVEVKSYRSKISGTTITSQLAFPIKPWEWSTGKGTTDSGDINKLQGSGVHKQFSLDRTAVKIGALTGKEERGAKGFSSNLLDITVDDVIWSFHKFKTKDQNRHLTTQNPSLSNIKADLLQRPKRAGKLALEHMVLKSEANDFIDLGQAQVLMDVMQSSLKQAVLDDLANTEFE